MAEFTKTVNARNRMCGNFHGCAGCPLEIMRRDNNIGFCPAWIFPEKAEAIILKWAKDNPIRHYPTWNEWYSKTYPNADANNVCPRWFTHVKNCTGTGCITCGNSEIPEEVAKNFGIEPIRIEV